MKIANLFEDIDILKQVQVLAQKIIKEDPSLSTNENEKLSKLVTDKFTKRVEI